MTGPFRSYFTGVSTLLLLLASGCDSTTEPSVSVSGLWRFNFSSSGGFIGSPPIVCNSSLDITITQQGTTFTGVRTGFRESSCEVSSTGEELEPSIGEETILNRTVDGHEIEFQFGPISGEGEVNGRWLNGTLNWDFDPWGGLPILLGGDFNALKTQQPLLAES